MVKSVVRAMDTVQAVTPMAAQKIVSDFILAGFSKRGAVSWLTSVVDPRIIAISPGVIDFLNVAPHIEHHFSAYGFYSSAVQPYVDKNIVRWVRTPEGQDLIRIINPYSYLENRALRQCVALRLNVVHKELGWYTHIQIDDDLDDDDYNEAEVLNGLLWQLWQGAHDAFVTGNPSQAKEICEEINEI